MRADQIGEAYNAAKVLIMARQKRRHLVHVEQMSVHVECGNGCCYDELEVAISDAVRLTMLEEIDAEIAVAVQELTALGVTNLDDYGCEDPLDHGDEDEDEDEEVAA